MKVDSLAKVNVCKTSTLRGQFDHLFMINLPLKIEEGSGTPPLL